MSSSISNDVLRGYSQRRVTGKVYKEVGIASEEYEVKDDEQFGKKFIESQIKLLIDHWSQPLEKFLRLVSGSLHASTETLMVRGTDVLQLNAQAITNLEDKMKSALEQSRQNNLLQTRRDLAVHLSTNPAYTRKRRRRRDGEGVSSSEDEYAEISASEDETSDIDQQDAPGNPSQAATKALQLFNAFNDAKNAITDFTSLQGQTTYIDLTNAAYLLITKELTAAEKTTLNLVDADNAKNIAVLRSEYLREKNQIENGNITWFSPLIKRYVSALNYIIDYNLVSRISDVTNQGLFATNILAPVLELKRRVASWAPGSGRAKRKEAQKPQKKSRFEELASVPPNIPPGRAELMGIADPLPAGGSEAQMYWWLLRNRPGISKDDLQLIDKLVAQKPINTPAYVSAPQRIGLTLLSPAVQMSILSCFETVKVAISSTPRRYLVDEGILTLDVLTQTNPVNIWFAKLVAHDIVHTRSRQQNYFATEKMMEQGSRMYQTSLRIIQAIDHNDLTGTWFIRPEVNELITGMRPTPKVGESSIFLLHKRMMGAQ